MAHNEFRSTSSSSTFSINATIYTFREKHKQSRRFQHEATVGPGGRQEGYET